MLGVVGLITVAAFWSGFPFILGAAAIALGTRAGASGMSRGGLLLAECLAEGAARLSNGRTLGVVPSLRGCAQLEPGRLELVGWSGVGGDGA